MLRAMLFGLGSLAALGTATAVVAAGPGASFVPSRPGAGFARPAVPIGGLRQVAKQKGIANPGQLKQGGETVETDWDHLNHSIRKTRWDRPEMQKGLQPLQEKLQKQGPAGIGR